MTTADVLDGAIAVLKAAPGTVLGITAALALPLETWRTWVERDTVVGGGLGGLFDAAGDTSGSSVLSSLSDALPPLVLSSMVLSFVAGAIAWLVMEWYAGRSPSGPEALAAAGRRLPALLGAWVLVHLCEAVAGIALLVPALFVMAAFLLTAPVIVVEGLGPVAGMRRSLALTRRHLGPVLGTALLIALVEGVLDLALTATGLLFTGVSWGWVVTAVCRVASALVTIPFVAAATTLVYVDRRVRTEGFDIEAGLAHRFPDGA